MFRQSALRTAAVVAFGGLVAACSETGFQDFLGAGKYAPDETQVSVNQPLSVPPDLQLRPPSDAEPERVASQPRAAGQLQQPQDLTLAPETEQPQPPAAPAQPPAAQPQPPAGQAEQQTASAEPQDVYARWGVSRHHPDGREKTRQELNEEMRQKKLERERQRDPNYGTIWNLGSIWSDG